jgi:hypothetical protein
MKHSLLRLAAFVLAVAVALPAAAQVQSGTIYGKVVDESGAVLPGVTLTLTGPDAKFTAVSSAQGEFRFLNLAPGTYTVTAELTGFTRYVREDIGVVIGRNAEIPVQMKLTTVEETITVSGESPVVDTRNMGTATNFTQDELDRIPTSRDPWALLRTVPGVIVDRINIAGNETGQQSGYAAKGTPSAQTVWTMDGIVITDMAAVGASPSYFDYDAFDEIQASTSGQDIKQQTGGLGLNLVVKRGTNRFRGNVKGYYTGDSLESSNVPDQLKSPSPGGLAAVTPQTADHNKEITEVGFDAGGPLVRDRAWIWGSWVKQDIRLVRASGNLIDRTILKTYNVKGNWQVTRHNMFNVLWFLGDKIKYGRGTGSASFEPPSATWNQGNLFPDNRPHGLLKFEDSHTFGSSLFVTAKYGYFGTGFSLEPGGGLDGQSGISTRLGQSFGTTRAARFLRPQHTLNVDANWFRNWGGSHDIKFGFNWRRTDAFSQTLWPGDMVVGLDNSATDTRARLYREGAGTDRTEYRGFYIGDTYARNRLTLDFGLRYDRQGGKALPSDASGNKAFPNLLPGISFAGYDAPFEWNNWSPRVGFTYALDAARKTILRGGFSRYAGQLNTGAVGYSNPSAQVGFVDYRWQDLNGDHFVQPGEILFNQGIITFGGGFNPAAPTAVRSANVIDPDLKAPVTTGFVLGVERELFPNFAVSANFTHGRTKNFTYTPWNGLDPQSDYVAGATLTGTLPGGGSYSIPTYIPIAARVAAIGNSRIFTNYDGYESKYSGVELGLIKRMSNRWMSRVAFGWNNATENWEGQSRPVNNLGNPTRLDTETLVNGGQYAPRTAGSGAGDVFVNGKWQFNANGAYMLPWSMEVAANLFGKQGTPYPIIVNAALGNDGSQRVLLSPELDTTRLDKVWNLDLRWSKDFRHNRFGAKVVADLFNVTNGNYAINRIRNLASPNFDRITQNLSPRILRLGIRFTF